MGRRSTGPGGPVSGFDQGFAAPRNVQGVQAAWTGRGAQTTAFADAGHPSASNSQPGRTCAPPSSWMTSLRWPSAMSGPPLPCHPHTWRSDLAAGAVDLLFVESAWAGNGGLWRGKLTGPNGPSAEFRELVAVVPGAGHSRRSSGTRKTRRTTRTSCPPPGSSTTSSPSDSGRMPQYRADLGHDRVVRAAVRRPAARSTTRPGPDTAGTAGTLPSPECTLPTSIPNAAPRWTSCSAAAAGRVRRDAARAWKFSPASSAATPSTSSPAPLDSRVVGSLTYAQMLSAYKAYKVFLNVNSVMDSPQHVRPADL